LYDEFLYACIIEICRQSIEPVFNHLLHHYSCMCCPKTASSVWTSENHLEPGPDCREYGEQITSQEKWKCYVQTVFTFWTALELQYQEYCHKLYIMGILENLCCIPLNLLWNSKNMAYSCYKMGCISITNFMELTPSWEATNCVATQELLSKLCNLKVHYHVHKSPPLVPILSQIDPAHTTPSYLSKIHFNIIYPTTSLFVMVSFLVAFPPISYTLLTHSCYMPCLSHHPWLHHSNYTWQRV
jgi:hypothetical protein